MRLADIVKYVNIAYAGIMLGLAAYFIVLIKYGYTFIHSSSSGFITINQLFASGSLGPAALGIIPSILAVMIILTIAIVILNMFYENSLKPPAKGVRRVEHRRERKEKERRKR
ncbi:hypothetical protein B7L70_02825 [Vulcanisaeta sp. EB80]|uniref:hypothetical protein n=1 Tax=Vulcanisaeta sp. EB80 TaxID=1650660 RepID=UPI0009C101C2|nr:hypothetical protein [Vulcanisaeta sp. EB80]PLC68581.1 hypothetical protein B7L70_02825 [Vulcanisaeta sp. EB80]